MSDAQERRLASPRGSEYNKKTLHVAEVIY